MRHTINKQQKYYFPDQLKEQLSQISPYPLTMVEVPSGFGKTAAVREYLRNGLLQAACAWYTCRGESPAMAWVGICELLAKINRAVAEGMKSLKMPAMDTLLYMRAYLKKLKCRRKTHFVIDNYQLIKLNMHRELINVFSMHQSPNLYVILITQQLDSRPQLSVHNDNIHALDIALPDQVYLPFTDTIRCMIPYSVFFYIQSYWSNSLGIDKACNLSGGRIPG